MSVWLRNSSFSFSSFDATLPPPLLPLLLRASMTWISGTEILENPLSNFSWRASKARIESSSESPMAWELASLATR